MLKKPTNMSGYSFTQDAKKSYLNTYYDREINKLLKNKQVPSEFLSAINHPSAIRVLKNQRVQALIARKKITPAHIKAIKHESASEALMDRSVQRMIIANLPIDRYLAAIHHDAAAEALQNKSIQKLIYKSKISPAFFSGINNHFLGRLLQNEIIQQNIVNGRLKPSSMTFFHSSEMLKKFEKNYIQQLFSKGLISVAQISQTPNMQRLKAFENEWVIKYIEKQPKIVDHLLNLRDENIKALHDKFIQSLIDKDDFQIKDVLKLHVFAIGALQNAGVQKLINSHKLTADSIAHIDSTYVCRAILDKGVQKLIEQNYLTELQVLTVTDITSELIRHKGIQQLIREDKLTDQHMRLINNRQQLIALLDNETIQRIRNDELTVDLLLNAGLRAADQINVVQSTHTASVHQTTSESAKRLFKRYGAQINGKKLDLVIDHVKKYINQLPKKSHKHQAAKRCIDRITAYNYCYEEPVSKVSLRQLMALIYIAMHDDTQRIGAKDDALTQFIEGLYEIQRGYNITEKNKDIGGTDAPICIPGTFNKLIEKLQSIHPDCEIHYVTKELASLKLPKVVSEETISYLKKADNLSLIEQVEAEGINYIWDNITEKVATRMFDEFGSLYESKQNDEFVGFIDAGQYTATPDLTQLKMDKNKDKPAAQKSHVKNEKSSTSKRSEYLKTAAIGVLIAGATGVIGATLFAGACLGAVFLTPILAASTIPMVASAATGLGIITGLSIASAVIGASYGTYKATKYCVSKLMTQFGNKHKPAAAEPAEANNQSSQNEQSTLTSN